MNPRTSRAPNSPSVPLSLAPGDIRVWTDRLLRIGRTQGAHVLPFGALRTHGPVGGMRWDPHPPGIPGQHAARWGVLYASSTLEAACAEVSQHTRVIDRRTGDPVVTVWSPSRPLHLLDLGPGSTWLIRHRASSALISRPAQHCQAWAHEIVAALGASVDGLLVPSMWTGTNVVLFGRAHDAFPPAPSLRVPLADPAIFPILEAVATRIGATLV